MLQVRLLGAFSIKAGKKTITLPSRSAQSLFAYLILNAGTPVRREKLAGQMWPDSTEEAARDYLRHALWRIRKVLQPASAEEFLQADDLTVTFLSSPAYQLDTAILARADESQSASELITALSAYQGELLPGFYDEWVVLEREHLQAIFERGMGHLLDMLQAGGRWQEMLEWGEKWIALGQRPEPAYRALMAAHAAQGDMSKVAATYERCLKSLKEFGVEPSEVTAGLYEKLKAGQALAGAQSAVAAIRQEEPPASNIPVPLTSFVGRDKEVQEIIRLLSTVRLLALTGPGGVGKTRLAIQAADKVQSKFKDGVRWVELASLSDPDLLPQAIASALSLHEVPSRPWIDAIQMHLGSKKLLLVLDNCEHLIAACAEIAERLMVACPNLKILATSLEGLGAPGETTWVVPSMALPAAEPLPVREMREYESILLFAERAKSAESGFELTEQNAESVAQVCRRLDGIPLAIELAAARVKLLRVEEIAERLNDRFRLLTGGSRTALPRHRTLRSLIDWSHSLLSDSERVLLRRLSVFAGGCTLEAAERVCPDEAIEAPEILDLLAHLVDKSLVMVKAGSAGSRYQMLETIRQYAQEKLSESGEVEQMRDRHLDYMLAVFEGPGAPLTLLRRWDPEIDNLRLALEWALSLPDPEAALRLAAAPEWLWWSRGYSREEVGWLRTALGRPGAGNPSAARAKALSALGWHLSLSGDLVGGRASLTESVAVARAIGDKASLVDSLTWLGLVISMVSDQAACRELLEEGLSLSRELGYTPGMGRALIGVGQFKLSEGDYAAAQAAFEESAARLREIGDSNSMAWSVRGLGYLALRQGDYRRAFSFCAESLKLNLDTGDRRGVANCLTAIASIAGKQGRLRRAARLYGAAAAVLETFDGQLIPSDEIENKPYRRAIQAELGEDAFQRGYSEGHAMNTEQALAYGRDQGAE